MVLKIQLEKLKLNPGNPRTMSDFMKDKLVESLLVFPQMLSVRPIIVNKDMVVLGGNQRLSVLQYIASMQDAEIEEYLGNQSKYRMGTDDFKAKLKSFWSAWKGNPVISVKMAEDMTPEEEYEFLTKDNLHYGEDDVEILKKEFDRVDIEDYIGTVPWNFYDYDNNKINDTDRNIAVVRSETFKCGYVETHLTDKEKEELESILRDYCEQNFGSSDGFLSYLLGIPYKADESNNNEIEELEDED